MKKRLIVTSAIVAALTLSSGCVTAYAAGTASDTAASSGYSYLQGRQRSVSRNEIYAQAELLPEEEREAFLAENGISETPYSAEAAASYGYVTGQRRGASYRQSDDSEGTQDMSGYSFHVGQARGSSYQQ